MRAVEDYTALYQYCSRCGRKLEQRERPGRFDERTGQREIDVEIVCPRFDRSWRNLWWGGFHDAHVVTPSLIGDGYICLEVGWR